MAIIDKNVFLRGVIFEQRSGCRDGMSHTKVWEMIIPGGGNSKCEVLETGICLAYLRNHEKLV